MTVATLARFHAPPQTPSCHGKGPLFDSVDVADHLIAREVCASCPVIDWCRDEFTLAVRAATGVGAYAGPSGTWAGVLYNQKSKPIRIPGPRPVPSTRPRRKSAGKSLYAGKPCLRCGRTLGIRDRSIESPERPVGVVWHHAHGWCTGCFTWIRNNTGGTS